MKALVTVKCCLLFKVELSRELHMLQLGASVGFSASRDEGRSGVGERILLSPLLFKHTKLSQGLFKQNQKKG